MKVHVRIWLPLFFTPVVLLALPLSLAGQAGSKEMSSVAADARNAVVEREKASIVRLEDEWLNALTTANIDAITNILADDFLRPAPDYGNFVDKADLLSFYRSHLHPDTSKKKHIENMTVSIYGSTALARGTLVTTNSDGGVISKLLFTDVFVQRNGAWQAVSAQENAVAAVASGKPRNVLPKN